MGLLARAAGHVDRVSPQQAWDEHRRGEAFIVDIRTSEHREAFALIPGAIVTDLTVLPWRLDPTFAYRIPEAVDWDRRWILICRHGWSSLLAAWNLQVMGLKGATDVAGGFEAWAAAGLPTTHADPDIRR